MRHPAGPTPQEAARRIADRSEVQALLAAGDGVLIMDDARIIHWASPSCGKAIGHPAAGLVGHNAWHAMVAPTDMDNAIAMRAYTDAGDARVWGRYKSADGKFAWLSIDLRHMDGFIVAACRKEYDAAKQHWHGLHQDPSAWPKPSTPE